MKILLGTRNKGKFQEITQVLSELPVTVLSLDEAGITHDPEEHGTTYEDNAVLKARAYAELGKLPTVADDSGIVIEALAGELGVLTRRWGAGKDATDEEWISHFLNRMRGEQNKRAEFVSVVAFVDEKNDVYVFRGVCRGRITTELDGQYLPGLPLRSCFIPDGFDCTLSRMTYDEEKTVNHRYKSMTLLKEHLLSHLPA
jgi:XTP/dITP diphosphohydrolase